MTEADIQRQVLLLLGSRPDTRVFRNSVGRGWTGETARQESGLVLLRNARPVTFGLAVGSSDLIGWHAHTITAADVGRTVALFLAAELKTPRGRATPEQIRFLDAVRAAGGIAGIVRCEADALALIGASL